MSGRNRTVYLNEEADKIIDENQINLSKFVSEQLLEHFRDLEIIEAEIQIKEKQLKKLRQQREVIKKTSKKIILDKNLINELYDINLKLPQGYNLDAMFRRFNNNNGLNMKKSEFLILLQQHKPKEVQIDQ